MAWSTSTLAIIVGGIKEPAIQASVTLPEFGSETGGTGVGPLVALGADSHPVVGVCGVIAYGAVGPGPGGTHSRAHHVS